MIEPEFNITPKSLRPLRLLRPLNVAEQEADQLRQRVAELERELRHEQMMKSRLHVETLKPTGVYADTLTHAEESEPQPTPGLSGPAL